MKRGMFLFVLLWSFVCKAQEDLLIFDENTFKEYVLANHPVLKQAELLTVRGEQEIIKAKGGFDPNLFFDYQAKTFDDKEYYGVLNGGVTIPTKYGVEIKGNYESANGLYLNPEYTLPDNGLWALGLSIPIGQGLLFDERRAVLKKAQNFAASTESQKQVLLNDLLYQAMTAYYNWVAAWQKQRVFENAVALSEERFEGVKERFFQGDLPAIDTLESFVQWQSRLVEMESYLLEIENTKIGLSNFLWSEEEEPLILSNLVLPPKDNEIRIDFIDWELGQFNPIANHPLMELYDYKLKELDIDQRWKREKVKPKAKLHYNFLNPTEQISLFGNNYKWGVSLSMPLFLRSARSEVQLGEIKILETNYQQELKGLEIQNKQNRVLNKFNTLQKQINLLIQNVTAYETLLNAEQIKFQIGESSVFLLNSREVKLLGAQLKMIETTNKKRLVNLEAFWINGNLMGLVF